MIKNHIKIAWRNIRKSKVLSGIHIFGLSFAIATATLLYLTAMFELSYDNFYPERERIGLAYTTSEPEEGITHSATMPAPFATSLKSELPSIELISRYYNTSVILRHGDKQFASSNKYVDADFLSIFSFPLLHGHQKALENLNGIVIDGTMANNLFGTTDVVGKQVEISRGEGWVPRTITAVIAPLPSNSSLTFTSLQRFEQKADYQSRIDDWGHEDHSVFVKMTGKINDAAFTQQTKSFIDRYYKDNSNMLKRDGAKVDKNGAYISLHLLPLDQYHRNDLGLGQAKSTLFPWILLIIAALILFIACSNFINLSLANSITRTKVIGTRKTLGGSTIQLIGQLWTESLMLCVIALVVGLGLAAVLLPEYNAAMNAQLSLLQLFSPINLLFFILMFVLLTLFAGGYPAWRLARINIIHSLKGTATVKGGGLRNSLTVVQFAIAIVLITATIVISTQLHYISERPLGFNKSEVISIPIGDGVDPESALQKMRVKLASQPWVQGVSASDINLGLGRDGNNSNSRFGFDYDGRQISTNFMRVDYDYLKTLHIKLIAGRDFDRSFSSDTAAVLINKQMAAQLGGPEKVLGKTLSMDGAPQIIGIIDDFNFKDLRNKVGPLTLSINPRIFNVEYIFVHVKTSNLRETLAQVENIWREINPKADIAASYLDENTQNMYKDEKRFAQIIIGGALVAIAISCLGLFALALLTINQRVKEIGIRKVLGSSVSSIVLLLSKDFVKLVILAFVVAAPLSWWMMKRWLQNFAYHIDLQWWMLVLAGVATVITALLTVSFKAAQAARANPVDSLRDE